jgi:hypothetical protein
MKHLIDIPPFDQRQTITFITFFFNSGNLWSRTFENHSTKIDSNPDFHQLSTSQVFVLWLSLLKRKLCHWPFISLPSRAKVSRTSFRFLYLDTHLYIIHNPTFILYESKLEPNYQINVKLLELFLKWVITFESSILKWKHGKEWGSSQILDYAPL